MDDLTICYGESVEIGIGIIEGGTPPYTIVWSNGGQGMSTTVSPTEQQHILFRLLMQYSAKVKLRKLQLMYINH